MLRQAVSLFTYRKKSTAMMVALLSLAAFLILSIAPIFTAILDTTFDGFVEKSGRFQATFFDLSEAQVAELRATPIVREVGLMENYGNLPSPGRTPMSRPDIWTKRPFRSAACASCKGACPRRRAKPR